MARNSTTWQPGQCPNPGGRPKVVREVREAAQGDAMAAYAKVKAIADKDGDRQQLAANLAILKAAGIPMSEEKATEPGTQTPGIPREYTPEQLEAAATKGEA